MRRIDTLTSDAKQYHAVTLEDGSVFTMTLRYSDNQKGWFYDLVYGTFTSRGRRLVTSPNMIRAFKNILPFGLSCVIQDNFEPVSQDDFTTGRAVLYILNSDDVQAVEGLILA